MEKRLYKVTTHLRDEYRRAFSAEQAVMLVWREYKGYGCRLKWRQSWTVENIAEKGRQ